MDKRMIKTKKAIRAAFVELAKERELNQITVTDIAKRADINRKTFYAHYSSIDDILTEMEDELVSLFEKDLEKLDFKNTEYPFFVFTCIAKRISGDFDLYRKLFSGRVSQTFFQKIIDMCVEKSNAFFADTPMSKEEIEIMSSFTIAGANYVYQRWFTRHPELSLDDLSQNLGILIMQGVNGYKKELEK